MEDARDKVRRLRLRSELPLALDHLSPAETAREGPVVGGVTGETETEGEAVVAVVRTAGTARMVQARAGISPGRTSLTISTTCFQE